MKKLILTALAVATFGFVSAQEEGIRFGAKGGLNIASISGDDTDDLDSRTSLHLGFVAEIPVTEKFAFQPELIYSAQGAAFDLAGEDVTIALDYLNLPLMGKFYVAEGLSIQAGPQIGFLLSSKVKVDDEDEDLEDVNGLDLGLNFGLGYQLDMGLFFDGRYNLGLSNLDDSDSSDDFSQKNSVIQISVGYKF